MARTPLAPTVLAAGATTAAAAAVAGARPTHLLALGLWSQRIQVDPAQAVALAAEDALWLLLAWLAFGTAVSALGVLTGRLGALGAAVARRTTPALLRRAVAVILGAGLSAGLAAPAAGAAESGRRWQPVPVGAPAGQPVAGVPGLTLDLPEPGEPVGTPAYGPPRRSAAPTIAAPSVVAPSVVAPSVAAPSVAARASAPPGPGHRAAEQLADVVVRPGDCLWELARHTLPPGADDAAIAAAWPRWWQANRAVVGADPDLLQPGQRLTPPES